VSTTARKARKRDRQLAIEAAVDVSDNTATRRTFVEGVAPAFRHPVKVGTPVEQRAENQFRGGVFDPMVPTGRSLRARRRIEARA
jgi:hypothetical protein